MPYMGNTTRKASDIRRFDVTGSTSATHTLTWTAPNEQSLIVTINGVKQHEDAYSVSGTTLTLTSALISTDKLEVIGINDIGTTITPAQNSVTADTIADGVITNAKIDASAAIALSKLNISGTGSSSNFLRGDGSWNSAGVDTLSALTDVTVSTSDPTISTNPSATGHYWVNKSSGECYVCTDNTSGLNVWTNVGDGTGTIGPFMVATGGTVTTDGNYKIHTFNSSGTFTVTDVGATGNVEYLVIGGGGGGSRASCSCGTRGAGGGGAGGYRANSAYDFTLTATSYTVTVGAGGAGGTGSSTSSVSGADGTTSTFHTIDAGYGGGGGGHSSGATHPGRAGSGGSGGGGANGDSGGSSGAYGNDGGNGGGSSVSDYQGGGGGGAGGAGTQGGPSGGTGGIGLSNDITGASVCRAGGGGGGGASNGSASCGGGAGGVAGTANTGGGGGGQDGADGLAGGSGVVIIRYQYQ